MSLFSSNHAKERNKPIMTDLYNYYECTVPPFHKKVDRHHQGAYDARSYDAIKADSSNTQI